MTDAALRPSLLPELELHAPTSIEELTNLVAGGCHPIGGATDVLLSAAHTGNLPLNPPEFLADMGCLLIRNR